MTRDPPAARASVTLLPVASISLTVHASWTRRPEQAEKVAERLLDCLGSLSRIDSRLCGWEEPATRQGATPKALPATAERLGVRIRDRAERRARHRAGSVEGPPANWLLAVQPGTAPDDVALSFVVEGPMAFPDHLPLASNVWLLLRGATDWTEHQDRIADVFVRTWEPETVDVWFGEVALGPPTRIYESGSVG